MPGKQRTCSRLTAGRFLLLALLCLVSIRSCFAHPMGNFSVNHYSKITFEQDGIRLRYFIDLAEIPTYQEMQRYGIAPGDPSALGPFLATRGAELERGLSLRIDGVAVPLRMVSKGVIFPPGAGGLPTMKLGLVFEAEYPHEAGGSTANLAFADANYPGHTGWKEIVVTGDPAFSPATAAPSRDRSAELSNYPTDMLSSPPQDLAMTVRFTLPVEPTRSSAASGGLAPRSRQQAVPATPGAPPSAVPRHRTLQQGPIPAHLSQKPAVLAPSPARVALAPVATPQAAPVEPMHLKANRQGTARDAFTELVSTQHLSLWFLLTAACISIGLGALHALEPGHGKTIVAAYLVGSRGTARHALLLGIVVTVAHTASVFALGAVTLYASRYILPEQLYPWLGLLSGLSIAVLGGYMFLRRWTRDWTGDWTGEEMDHGHTAGAMHGHWFSTKKPRQPVGSGAAPVNDFPAPLHAGTEATAKPVSLVQLCMLGITGGIIPCPAALVVLLSAFSLHRVGFGFFLISAFSVGLAAVLIGFGMLMVYARRFMTRLEVDGPLTRRWLPLVSAMFMTVLGLVIASRAFATTGLALHGFTREQLGPALFVAGLGLVLGIRHSTDTDHVVAISTIVSRQRSIRGAALIGSLWGVGHTLTIFAVGCLIILGGVVIPPRVGLSMEFSVALMLILLGLLNLTGIMQRIVARFNPGQSAAKILPSESIEESGREKPVFSDTAVEQAMQQNRPDARDKRRFAAAMERYGKYQLLRPLAIGLVHGLAGSAAIALLVLSTIHNPLWAIVYLLIFGGGTMVGMMGMTAVMAMPLTYAGNRLPQMSRYLRVTSGLVSVCFGSFLVYQLGYVGGLFTSHPHWTPQ